jgi:Protein of unknown function (DUF4238)
VSNKNTQHYNPEFYLVAWTDSSSPTGQTPYLWQADLQERIVKNKAPHNVAWLPYFYAIQKADGSYDQTVEDFLANIESESAPVIKKSRDGDFNLSQQERVRLSDFMGFQITRNPSFRRQFEGFWSEIFDDLAKQHASDPAAFADSIREWDQATGENLGMPIEDARMQILNNCYTISADPSVSLMPIVGSSRTPASLIMQMRWGFAIAPKDARFVTTDIPVFWTDPTATPPDVGVGLAAQNVQLTFPISPNVCLVAGWCGCEGAVQVSHELFEKVNRHILHSANKYVFSQTKGGADRALQFRYPTETPVNS